MNPLTAGTDPLLQYGPLGIFAALSVYAISALFRLIIKDKDRERARAEGLEEQLKAQNRYVQEQLIPTVLEMITITKEMNANSRAMVELVARMQYDEKRA